MNINWNDVALMLGYEQTKAPRRITQQVILPRSWPAPEPDTFCPGCGIASRGYCEGCLDAMNESARLNR